MARIRSLAALLVTLAAAHGKVFAQDAAEAAAPAREQLGDAHKLKILYSGPKGTEREKAFVEFLRGWFDTVESIDAATLSAQAAAPFDVVISDAKRLYPMDPNKGLDLPRAELDASFPKPVVMISAMGGTVQHHTKIDWL